MTKWSFSCHYHPGKYVEFNDAFEYRAALQDMLLVITDEDVLWVRKLIDLVKTSFG